MTLEKLEHEIRSLRDNPQVHILHAHIQSCDVCAHFIGRMITGSGRNPDRDVMLAQVAVHLIDQNLLS